MSQAPQREPPSPAGETHSPAETIPPLHIGKNELRLFEESPPLIASMLRDISAAQRRVWLESYIVADDAAGQAVAAALAERAAAGVDVRLMYDAVGSLGTPAAFFERLAVAGVKVHEYHSLKLSLFRFRSLRVLNQRNHRKLLVVDDRAAYFGGMNIVDQSGLQTPADTRARHLPVSAGWRDVHVRLSGPKLNDVAAAFDRLWQRVYGKVPRSVRRRARRQPRWPVRQMLAAEEGRIYFFDSRPSLKYRRPDRVLAPLIRRARHDITLSMAYFVPVGRVLRELLRARRRGVRIRVIIPGESDVRSVQRATRHFYRFLLPRGIRIYERKDQMLHSKVMVIDGRWTVVGSCNLDPRSLRFNLEFLAVIHARSLASAVLRICRFELKSSRRVRPADAERLSLWQRLLDRLAWSFRHWL